MKSLMVKGTLYQKAPTRYNQPHTEQDVLSSNMLVSRRWAEDLNEKNANDERGLQYFEIDEVATSEWEIANKIDREAREAKAKLNDVNTDALLKGLINHVSGSDSEEKPKRTRRTKKQIEENKED